jgi:hypothetical protein
MTVQKDVQRAGLRAMMAAPMTSVPDYSDDPKVLSRVGNVIGGTAAHEERHVRASDSLLRSTSRVAPPPQARHVASPANWLLSVSLGTLSLCTVGLLGVLAYWQFG